jgi:hypothetical protein
MSRRKRRGLEERLTAGVGMSAREDECGRDAMSEDGRSGIAHGRRVFAAVKVDGGAMG